MSALRDALRGKKPRPNKPKKARNTRSVRGVSTNPLTTEHSARQIDPDKCAVVGAKELMKGARKRGIRMLFCRVPGEHATQVQSLRFDASLWTPKRARSWLERQGFSAAQFVEASGGSSINTRGSVRGDESRRAIAPKT